MIDIRIFGVPERMECIRMNKALLDVPDNRIIIDNNHSGCIPTARKAWEIETKSSHILVLQDDIKLCKNFLQYCLIMAETHPDAIIGLYPRQFSSRKLVKKIPTVSPYIESKFLSGAGILMRSDYVLPCLDFWRDERRGDDVNIREWAKTYGIQILTTLPSTIQHIGKISVFDPTRSLGGTDFFDDDPSWVAWDNSYVTPWTNVIRR